MLASDRSAPHKTHTAVLLVGNVQDVPFARLLCTYLDRADRITHCGSTFPLQSISHVSVRALRMVCQKPKSLSAIAYTGHYGYVVHEGAKFDGIEYSPAGAGDTRIFAYPSISFFRNLGVFRVEVRIRYFKTRRPSRDDQVVRPRKWSQSVLAVSLGSSRSAAIIFPE